MPQLQLPCFPEGITLINQNIGFIRKDSAITYLYGSLPVLTHAIDDIPSFRMFTSQLYINGSATQAEISRAFGVSKISVLRSVKLYRERGVAGFFAPRICRGPAVLTPQVLEQVQKRLDVESGSRGNLSPQPPHHLACGSALGGSHELPSRSRVMDVYP